jgi:hypothetical protein
MTSADRSRLSQKLAEALLALPRDDAFDHLRIVFLEDEQAIPEISHDFGPSGFDELTFDALCSRLVLGSEQQLRHLARRLAIDI